jgi:hypothetical protein
VEPGRAEDAAQSEEIQRVALDRVPVAKDARSPARAKSSAHASCRFMAIACTPSLTDVRRQRRRHVLPPGLHHILRRSVEVVCRSVHARWMIRHHTECVNVARLA